MSIADTIKSVRSLANARPVAHACIAASVLALVGVAPAGAQASTVSFSYSGTVASGSDPSALFGGGDLTGATITVSGYYTPDAYTTTLFNQSGSYDIFFHDTAGASSVSVTLTTLSSTQYTRTLASGGSYIGNDFLDATSGGAFDYGTYGVMAGFGSTEATLQPQFGTTGGSWVSGTTIYGPLGTVTSLGLVASADATNGGLTDNITITNLTQNGPAPVLEPSGLTILGVAVAVLAGARRRRVG